MLSLALIKLALLGVLGVDTLTMRIAEQVLPAPVASAALAQNAAPAQNTPAQNAAPAGNGAAAGSAPAASTQDQRFPSRR